MKLLRLKLGVRFRSLPEGFEINFLRELDRDRGFEFHPYCLAGRNGSGKSNVLEALAAIFYHIECIHLNFRPIDFGADEFALRYLTVESHAEIPVEGRLLVIIAKVRRLLQIRVFNAESIMISDKGEAELQENELRALKLSLESTNLSSDPTINCLKQKKRKEIVYNSLLAVNLPLPNGFTADEAIPDAFELEYLCVNADQEISKQLADNRPIGHIRISKAAGERPQFVLLNRDVIEPGSAPELFGKEVKPWLPSYILAYSSGHNEVLSLPFFKMRFIHFDEYCDKLARDDHYGKPEGRMTYLDDQFIQAILLCHFLFPSDAILRVFKEEIKLTGIRCFRIIIRRHHHIAIAEERLKSMQLTAAEKKVRAKNTVELTSKLGGNGDQDDKLQLDVIDKLIKCSTCHHEKSYITKDGAEASDLYLDYFINDATKQAFQVHFSVSVARINPEAAKAASNAASALNLFQALQTLLTLNHYQVGEDTKAELYKSDSLYLNETIPMPASHERIMRFKDFEIIKNDSENCLYGKSFSDGEHQLLHTIGLCLLYRHESALFLLDEPETHLNPSWRASYVSTLRDALNADGISGVMSDILLTSHSPFVISDCRPENVLVFEKDERGTVTCRRPDFNTFGASANLITMKIFGQTKTIGNYAMETLTNLRNHLNTGDSPPDDVIDTASRELGDSVEKILFINEALNRKEGK
jgi:restriction system-associated AAA family ATPase